MTTQPRRADVEALDRSDPLAHYRDDFVIEDDTLIYLDGNSLGRLPKASRDRVQQVLQEEWGTHLISSWQRSWLDLPTRIGDLIGTGLLGAGPGEVVISDNTTVALYKAINTALDARPARRGIVIERGNFPTDRYVVEGLAQQRGAPLHWIEETGAAGVTSRDLAAVLDESVAVVVLSHVDYRSAAVLDMAELTELAHGVGALMVWDLCHSVGAVPVDLGSARADLAVGCTYKYLNGGPGSPAFTFVRSALQSSLRQPIWGWWGQAAMFDMEQGYQASRDIRAWLTGTPGVLSMAAIEPGVEMIVKAGIDAIRAKSVALTELAVRLYDAWLAPVGYGLASPRDPARRGSHVTVTHPRAYDISLRMPEENVIPDFRRPDGIRLGLAPLTTRFVDVYDGLQVARRLAAQ
ncbi:MAG: kynureninase [Nocardioidaceae bacterium]